MRKIILRRLLNLTIIIIMIFAVSSFQPVIGMTCPETVYVDDDFDSSTPGWGYDHFDNIQDGIDAVCGSTVYVAPGSYAGANVDKSVSIIGSTIGDSIITSGVHYGGGHPSLTTAFHLDTGSDGTEINNFIINCDQSSFFFFGIFSRGIDDVIIDSLTVNDAVQGITNWGGSNWVITNNELIDTVASGGGGIGIYLGVYPPYTDCSGNLVQYNSIYADITEPGYTAPGICLALDVRYDYHLLTGSEEITNNDILDNEIIGTGNLYEVGIETGVIGVQGDPVKIAYTMGMVHDNFIQGNTIDGSDYGIYAYVVEDLSIIENEVKNCVTHGISIWDDFTGNINCNEIHGNTYGLYNDITSTINATCNWWGDSTGPSNAGPGIGDPVSTNVDFDPWIGKVTADAGGPYVVNSSEPVQFDASGSITPCCCNELVEYKWDYGDGQHGSGINPTHTYLAEGGTFNVTLTVTIKTLIGEYTTDQDTTTVSINDIIPPNIILIYPLSGMILKGTVTIKWHAYDWNDGAILPIYIYYSNGDDNWYQINDVLENTGEYEWDTTQLSDGTYRILVEALDSSDNLGHNISGFFEIRNEGQENQPPYKPSKPSGPTSGKAGKVYEYTSSATDPDGDKIYYKWDWGDETSDWDGPYNSGETATASHIWDSQGTYEIKVKVKDAYDEESPWSDPLSVTMPKNKTNMLSSLIKRFFNQHPYIFPIIRYILGL